MKKIDHHSDDKRGCHVWILHMGSSCTKCSFSLWSPWLSLGVWLWRKLEAVAPAYDLESSRMITRISLRLLHKVVTILFLTALLWLKKSGDGWVAAFWRKPLLLGLNHHLVWNQAVSSDKFCVWALCFFHETNVVSTENIFFSPLQIPNTPKISVWRCCQRKCIFISYAAIVLCCDGFPRCTKPLRILCRKKFPWWTPFFH